VKLPSLVGVPDSRPAESSISLSGSWPLPKVNVGAGVPMAVTWNRYG
jgi:hypothetical protein